MGQIIQFPNKLKATKRTLCAMTTPIYCSYISDQPMYCQEEANYEYDDQDDLDDCIDNVNAAVTRVELLLRNPTLAEFLSRGKVTVYDLTI